MALQVGDEAKSDWLPWELLCILEVHVLPVTEGHSLFHGVIYPKVWGDMAGSVPGTRYWGSHCD